MKGYTSLLSLFLVVVFFPSYVFDGTVSTGQALLFLFLPALLVAYVIFTVKKWSDLIIPFEAMPIMLVAALLIFTVPSKAQFIDVNISVSHLRYLAYSVVFILSYNIFLYGGLSLKDLEKSMYVVSLLVMIFILLQLINHKHPAIAAITPRAVVNWTGFRVAGPYVWSYIFAFCSMPLIFMGIHQFASYEGTKFKTLITLGIASLMLLTQSKAAYIAVVGFGFLWMVFYLFNYRRKFRVLLMLFSMIGIGSIILYHYGEHFSHILKFIEAFGSGRYDNSTSARLQQFLLLQITVDENLLLGSPRVYGIIENAYAHYFYYYGITGLLSYLLLYAWLLGMTLKKARVFFKAQRGEAMGVHVGMVAFTFSVFVYALGSSPTDANKSSYVFFILLAAYLAANRNFFNRQIGTDTAR